MSAIKLYIIPRIMQSGLEYNHLHNKLCGDKLKLVAVIHSVLEEKLEVLKTEPFLEIVAGKWEKWVDSTKDFTG